MKNLKKLRELAGLSQQKLGNEIGLARNTICQYESGNRVPDVDTLIKIAEYFNVSIDYLLGRELEEKNQPTQNERVDIKPAYARKRKETADMLMYRYQNVIDEEYFWLLVELCSHIKRKDGLDLFTTLCNAMIEKGYPGVNYYIEAYKYFVNGEIQPQVWNVGVETLTEKDKEITLQNIANALSDKFAKDYAMLIQDKSFRETAKLYNEITPQQREVVVGIIAAYFIGTLHKDTYPIIGR